MKIISRFRRGGHLLCIVATASLLCSLPTCNEKSIPVSAPAGPDTTSHDFVWEEIIIGEDHTDLYDICALNENDIWIVGLIRVNDPNNKRGIHSGVHWDGIQWQYFNVPNNRPNDSVRRVGLVWATSPNDVWFSPATHWDGKRYKFYEDIRPMLKGGLRRMWGDSKRMYIVGDSGGIYHFDYKSYNRIDMPGLTYAVNDVWGSGDTAFCVASEWLFDNTPTRVIRLVGTQGTYACEQNVPRAGASIWFMSPQRMFLTADGCASWENGKWTRIVNPPGWKGFKVMVRGSGYNNIFMIGHYSSVAHYNGASWRTIDMNDPNYLYHFKACAVLQDDVYIIGRKWLAGVLLHGRWVKPPLQ
jgi:hypothetical protein